MGALVVMVAIVGFFGVSASVDEFRRVTEQEIQQERVINTMVADFKKQVQEWKNVLIRGADRQQREKYWGKFQNQERVIREAGQHLLDDMPASPARGKVEGFIAAHKDMGSAYRAGFDAFVAAGFDHRAGDKAVKGIDRAPTKLLEEAAADIAAQARTSTATALERAAAASSSELLITVLAVLLGVVGAIVFLSRFVLQPMRRSVTALNRLSEGDFTVEILVDREDELGQLSKAAQRIRDDLGQLLRDMAGVAQQLDESAGELAAVSDQNRARLHSQQQVNAQVATATEELAATAQEVASNAAAATEAVTEADQSTRSGLQVVEQAVDSINRLQADVGQVGSVLADLAAHSSAIGNVLNVIRGIAEQTNLLALNAAIEAARAGDQGRGFAVVADEVRSLAQRTQESTQEIHQTIEQLQAGAEAAVQAMEHGQQRVEEGVTKTQEVGQALDHIATSVATIVNMSAQIATAAGEQGCVAADVSRNVNDIEQGSEELLSSAAAIADASHALVTASNQLTETAARFKL
jgi:methyl-accepting chemotaxis protein